MVSNSTPQPPPLTVRVKEAMRLLSLGRSTIYNLMDSGALPNRKSGSARLIDHVGIVAYRDSLLVITPKPPQPTGPLLPADLQQLAAARAREPGPDFAGLFTEHLESLSPSLGEDQSRRRALAHTIRAYRRYHECAYKPARAAVLALITPKPAPESALAPEPEPWVHE
jgi:excisionase family DNA binding protein